MTECVAAAIFPSMIRSDLPRSLRAVLQGAVDYAGLFPPAALPMEVAVGNYGTYRRSPARWALGRFVLPAARLPELSAALGRSGGSAWSGAFISATVGADLTTDLGAVTRFNSERQRDGIRVDALEAKVGSEDAIEDLRAQLPAGIAGYGEIPLGGEDGALLDRLKAAELNAKIRMGGVTAELFPTATAVATFLRDVATRRLSFKATAGLHHPLRGEYCLTYQEGSPRAPMFGFINLAVATLAALDGETGEPVAAALLETDAAAIQWNGSELRWRGRRYEAPKIARLRELFHGFGSCSFEEPIHELEPALGR